MAQWIGWVRLEAPDRDTAHRRLEINLAGAGVVTKVQSVASFEVSEEELRTALRNRKPGGTDGDNGG